MDLKGKKIAVFVEKFYEDLELWYPVMRFREAGAEVAIIGPKRGETYESKHGYPAKAELAIGDARPGDYDALIIPGGYSPDHMRRHPPMMEFVREMHRKEKLIASICHGPWMMASAGIIKGKNITGFFSIKDDLVNAGAKFVDEEVVVDGNIVTSRTPADLPAFCRAIFDLLAVPTVVSVGR